MKLESKQISICIAVILSAVVIGQGIWIYNMYNIYHYQLSQAKETAIEAAILKEYNVRYERLGGTIVQAPVSHNLDTARYVTKTVQSRDTSFEVTFDRFDPYADTKLSQFMLKHLQPVDIDMLSQFFKEELATRGFLNVDTYVEYIDVKNNLVIEQSDPNPAYDDYEASELKVIDIFDTIGIRAYVHISAFAIVKKMTFQLILSVILIAICIFLLFTVIRTFFWRERIEQMRQDSVNAMTHEFKRPISSAVAQAALIPYYLQKDQTEKVQQYAGNVLLELNKLTAYTERIQKLSNNDKNRVVLNKENIEIKDFFEGIVKKYRNVEEKRVDISLSLPTALKYIQADHIHFSNIIENLIENAIKYSDQAVSIAVTVSEPGTAGSVKISIADNGFGIPDTDIPRIFDKFYRSSDKTVQQRVGFGLGLTYVKAIIEAHGGEIKVKSKFGEGSEFIVLIPVKSDAQ
ncbi:hypothetical protein GCM10011386_12890 [Parapedobacter defluvii]|uniref:histidine kinase n=1 Tax=Parapedobacter defluvii TaxID=2045106 RepID=A0ABQ1LDI2_9SPHI|nr:HAMP domain-containing sensor histidine kinase [Parapedobacter defluvii]GGC22374.1 hypothetical protein GCM10011386_12890 [Parapedobacter defluvii]